MAKPGMCEKNQQKKLHTNFFLNYYITDMTDPIVKRPSGLVREDSQNSSFRSSLRKSLPRGFLRFNSSKTLSVKDLNWTDDMIRLETLILSPKGKQSLIQGVLKVQGDPTVKIRFITSVTHYDNTEGAQERKKVAQKIIEMFVQGGQMFTLNFSEELTKSILDGNHNRLLEARRDILEHLSLNPEIMSVVKEVELEERD
jgi:hypothetical protein